MANIDREQDWICLSDRFSGSTAWGPETLHVKSIPSTPTHTQGSQLQPIQPEFDRL